MIGKFSIRLRNATGRPDLAYLAAILLSIGAALPLLVGPGIVNTRAGGDSPFLLQRTYELAASIRAGAMPAQWMSLGAYGLGYPFFGYYAALPYYLAAILALSGAGILWGVKLAQLLGFITAGAATYALVRRMGAGRRAALLASAVYTFAPFHLINIYVRGDSLSEFYAMALYPVILYALLGLEQNRSAQNVALLALSYALLMLTHNISALLFTPLAALALLFRAAHHRERDAWLTLGFGLGALGLGLILSAWFWIPALKEQSLVQLQDQTTGYFNYAGHFRSANLVQTKLWHDYTIDGKHNPFSMGLGQAVLALAGMIALGLRWFKRQKIEPLQGLALMAFMVYTWLITPTSRWVWDHIPLLPMVQFPWRLLSVQALAIALLSSNIPALVSSKVRGSLTLPLVVLITATGMVALRVDRLPLREADVSPARLMFYETYSGNIGTTVRYEYLPREMVPRPYTSAVQWQVGHKPAPLVLEGEMGFASLLSSAMGREVWQINVPVPALLAFHTTYNPGWRATVDGRAQPIQPLQGLGLLGLRLEPGEHQIKLRLERTGTRCAAWWLSVLGLPIWLVLLLYNWPRSLHTRRQVLAAGAALLLGAIWISFSPWPARGAAPPRGPVVADFARAPYLHQEPGGVLWGQARLTGYGLSAEEGVPGQTIRLTTTWDQPWPQYQLRVALVAATAHLLEPAPVWAEAAAPLDATSVSLALTLPEDTPPGLYVLRLSAWQGSEPHTPRTAAGVRMGALVLEPVQVQARRQATGREPVLGAFGPENVPPVISLVGASVHRTEGAALIALDWRSERQAPLNYALSVRLRASQGQSISRDLPPLLANYPTSLWRPGELVSDRVLVLWPDNKPLPGGPCDLEVVLYDRLSLKAAGTATIPVMLPD